MGERFFEVVTTDPLRLSSSKTIQGRARKGLSIGVHEERHGSPGVVMAGFHETEHTADWAFSVQGRDLRELFVQAARAMFQLQGQLNNTQPPSHVRDVEVDGFDRETLLVNWLNELLYLQEMNNETYANLEIREISDTHLTARLHGQSGQPNRRLIKAVTFHGLKVEQSEGAWRATMIVDV